jgi:hypothetical protein
MIRPRLHARQAASAQQLADCPLMHHDLVALGNKCLKVYAAPAHHSITLRVRSGKHQLFQLLQLLFRQCRRTAAARRIAQPGYPGGVVAMHPVPQRLPVHARRPCRLRAVAALQH